MNQKSNKINSKYIRQVECDGYVLEKQVS